MEIPLEGARAKCIWLAVSLVVAALIVLEAGRIWLADYRIHSENPEEMARGAALAPGNADGWDLLGRFYQLDFMRSDMTLALANYRKAVARNPLSANYWMDLANAYEATGDMTQAQNAFEHAKAVYPTSAEVAFHYGNFLLREQKYPEAYSELRRAVQTDRTLLPLAISRAWRASGDANELLDRLIPADVDGYLQALDFFGSTHNVDASLIVWSRLLKLGGTVPLARTLPLLDELIRDDRAGDARHVWREALGAARLPYQEPANGSLIWNGDFRQEFSNGGLDWRWQDTPGTSIDFDVQAAPGNSRAVRLDFDGGVNVDLNAPVEYVPVDPGRSYHFRAYMRSEQITTESGPRVSITDPNHANALSVVTDAFTGTLSWTAVDAEVSTGPETHFVLVRLVRPPSRLFDNKLSGTVWIAAVSLVPSNTTTTEQRPR